MMLLPLVLVLAQNDHKGSAVNKAFNDHKGATTTPDAAAAGATVDTQGLRFVGLRYAGAL